MSNGEQGLRGEPGPPGPRGAGTLLLWALLGVGVALLIVTWAEVKKVEEFSEDIREYAIIACERNNDIRAVVRSIVQAEVEQSSSLPPSFFPDIPPAEFERLLEEEAARARIQLRELRSIPCDVAVPAPA